MRAGGTAEFRFSDPNQDVMRPSNVPGDYPQAEDGDSIIVDARALVGI